MNKKYLERFKELDLLAEQISKTEKTEYSSYSNSPYKVIDSDLYRQWTSSTKNLLKIVYGNNSVYYSDLVTQGERKGFDSNVDSFKRMRSVFIVAYKDYINGMNPIEETIKNHIFIGHGRSPIWRELKDFINEKLDLPWEEFNRVPVAGVTNIVRLSEMLNKSCMAFLIMTAEDEHADGNIQARMNVIHEVGLFQGKLGFEKAIVLLEEGCAEFSNINGLGQIRFPKGNISAIFQDIREVLERENIIS